MSVRDWAKSNRASGYDFTSLGKSKPQPQVQVQLVAPGGQLIPQPDAPPPQIYTFPQPQPPRQVAYSPPAAPVVIPLQSAAHPVVRAVAPIPETCQLVAPGPSQYEAALARVPDFSAAASAYCEQNGLGVHDGTDAMDLPGQPHKADMAEWSSTTQRTFGGRDVDGRRSFEEHLRNRHGVTFADIRRE